MHQARNIQAERGPFAAPDQADYPQARQDEHLVAQEVLNEFVIYDTNSHKVHNLNPTAATVWQWCDGTTSPDLMVEKLASQYDLPRQQAESLLWLTLDRLEEADLLNQKADRPTFAQTITRRQVIRAIGIATILPTVYTIMAPTAYAQSSVILECADGDDCNTQGGATITVYANENCMGNSASVSNNGNLCSNLCGDAISGGGNVRSFRVTAGSLQSGTDCSIGQCMNCAP